MNLPALPSFLRRITTIATALAASALLASCGGSSSTFSALVPTRIIAMGDGLADLGQVGGVRYTVNDASNNTWVQQVAASYGLGISAQAAGGQGWARGNARVVLKPDAAGSSSALTISEQVDAFLAANTIASTDIILLDAGLSDLWVQAQDIKSGSITEAQALLNAAEAGKALGALARRVVAAGGTHVVVAQTYNLGKSPYAIGLGLASAMENASLKYNEALKVSIVDLGANVLTLDSAYRYNLMINQPGTYGFSNSVAAACTTPDVTTCTAANASSGYDSYVFADNKYFTPAAQRSFGDYAYTLLKSRW